MASTFYCWFSQPRIKATQIATVLTATVATIVSGSISQPGQKQPLKPPG